jgi:hypothetical protein
MRLARIFVCAFLGVILATEGIVAFFKALGRMMEWLKVRTGRSDSEVTMFIYVMLMALVIATGFTAASAAGTGATP